MDRRRPGACGAAFAAALLALWPPPAPAAGQGFVLEVTAADGNVLFRRPLAGESRWCLRWNHSVAGFAVSDCYRHDGGRMMLEKSHQPDFAAGLGHVPGRGVQRAAEEGGYWIEDIDEPVGGNCYRLRVGSQAVDHRIAIGGVETSLSERAAGQSVSVAVRPAGGAGNPPC